MTMTATNWTNVTTIYDIMNIPNQYVSAWIINFWSGMLMMVFLVMLLTMIYMGTNVEIALLSSGFVCLILALILVFMTLINWAFVLFFIGTLVMLMIYIIWSSNRDNY